MTTKYNRGSEWRKWDMHVHTPASIVHHYGKNINNDDVWESYIQDIESLPNEIKVLGINDYIFLDGFKKVKEYKDKGRLRNIDLLLPVIELRLAKFCGHKEFKRINYHIIFSNEISAEVIEQQFLNALTSKYKLDPDSNQTTWGGVITKENLANLGKKIKESVPPEELSKYGSDLEEGFNNLNLEISCIETALQNASQYFADKYITAIGKTEWDSLNWNDSSIGEKKNIINGANIIFTASESIETFYKSKKKLEEQKVSSFLIDCSDSHHNSWSTDKDRLGNCFTWIKADPTFEGLKQILNEPDRVFIGETPELLKRIKIAPTKFIKNITIQKKVESTIDEVWYGDKTSIDINPGLVAIIGNKGSGKSAITDILSICANTHKTEFSFLSQSKFRNPRPYDRSRSFQAKIIWGDDSSTEFISLNNNGSINHPERVKYIPQNYLETLCNVEDDNKFEDEIKSIIFQHLSDENKYGKDSLDDLINYLSGEIKNAEKEILVEIQNQNERIIALEEKQRPEYAEKINSALSLKKEELDNLQKIKPAEVVKPEHSDNGAEQQKQKEIDGLKEELIDIINRIEIEQNKLKVVKKYIVDLGNAKERLERLNATVQTTISDLQSLFEGLELSVTEVINFSIDNKIIDGKINDLKTEEKRILDLLSEENINGLICKKISVESNIKNAENKLSEPDRLYHKYQEELKYWQSKIDAINGKDDVPDSIKYYEAQLKYIAETLETDMQAAYECRRGLIISLLNKKREELNNRAVLYQPVSDFINKYNEILKDYPISIDAVFIFEGVEKLFDIVSHQNSGTFYGKDNGMLKLREMKSSIDLNNDDSIYDFALSINNALKKDLRDESNILDKDIKSQLRKDHSVKELYDFIYGFEYIKPLFELKLDDKKLSTLSPGERGALLLLFYLFIDMDDKPLIIDQPEENLDNESVFKYLVAFIKMAKEKRQVIMVTHNPNLAVVCDAEQIIKMNIDKKNNNIVSYQSGSIENPEINKCIVNVLEGTYPAFHNRDQKYINKK